MLLDDDSCVLARVHRNSVAMRVVRAERLLDGGAVAQNVSVFAARSTAQATQW